MAKSPLYLACIECGRKRKYVTYCPKCMACTSKNRSKKPPEIRFWKHVDKTQECWNWTGSKYHHGYGSFNIYKKREQAHRFSWSIRNGPIPHGFCVIHQCDNTSCVNPEHLKLGTQKENVHDMILKRRAKYVGRRKKHD